jgi:protocatechuate 3,4-dioxygenase beta subunit
MLRWLGCVCLFTAVLAQQPGVTPPPPPSFQISGTVVDAVSNEPLSGARVAIAPVSKRDAFTTVVTGADGRFAFPGLTTGKYTLEAQRHGYVTQSFNQHANVASSIAVGPAQDSSNLVFTVIPEGSISGTVTDEIGDAVREAQVMLFQRASDEGILQTVLRVSATTDDEGHYRFSHRRPGRYFIVVSARPWYAQRPQTWMKTVNADGSVNYSYGGPQVVPENAPNVVIEEDPPSPLDVAYPLTFYGGATDSAAATPIQLGQGEKVTADITLQAVPAIHLRISNVDASDHAPQEYVFLEQKLFDTSIAVPAYSNQLRPGMMDVTGIPPGHYTANIHSIANGQELEKRDLEAGESGEIEKAIGGVFLPLTATLSFQPTSSVEGQLYLRLRDKNSNQVFSERINGNGDIEIKPGIPRGTYEISVQGGRNIFLRSIQATGGRVNGRMLEVKGSGPVKLSVVLSGGRGEVTGVALRGDKAAAGVLVVLVPADPANNRVLFRRDQSDSDGTFSLASVVPGRYTLLALADAWELEWTNPAVLEKFMPQGEPLTVESKGKYAVKVRVQ